MLHAKTPRRYPIGAELLGPSLAHFRVWAPSAKRLEVALQADGHPDAAPRFVELAPEGGGYFSGEAEGVGAGALYRFRLDGDGHSHPDPASRFQPLGPHGQSCVVDPRAFRWTDSQWRGLPLKGQVIYEMHVGAFTPEGDWAAAARELPELAKLGITVIEMMPVAEFAGRRGWGYDGVDLFAPYHGYGAPDDLRAFVDAAHAAGVAVILDVVYNHLGPEGNYLGVFSKDYFTDRYETDWGEPINFDGPNSGPVREFFIANARYWIEEFHFDGFRFDATQNIYDASEEYILSAITRAARAAANGRELIFIAENEPQETKLVRPYEEGGDGLHGLWNDDLHHTAVVTLTGRTEAYYTDYQGGPQEYISAAKYGYLYQGQHYKWQKQRRGSPALGLPPEAFVAFIENHDQVANTGDGRRIRFKTSPSRYRAMTGLLLLGPWTPMLFQGQEFGALADFLYFNDITTDLHDAVRNGRADFLKQFRSYASKEIQKQLADPFELETFTRCKLDFSEREKHAGLYAMTRDLLRLRREDAAFSAQRLGGVDGAVLGPESFLLRFFGEKPGGPGDRLLVVNFGRCLPLSPAPEPLLAPPPGCRWETLWTSELPLYGGPGPVPLEGEDGWRIPAESAVALRPVPRAKKKLKTPKKPKA
jgi:maltooligosyltrehalose trehalohydrolase